MRALTRKEYDALVIAATPGATVDDDETMETLRSLIPRGLIVETETPEQWIWDPTPLGRLALRVSLPSPT